MVAAFFLNTCMKELIEQWLRFENFAAGVQLLAKHNQRQDIVSKYSGLPNGTPSQRAELLAAMKAILKQGIEMPAQVVNIAPVPKPVSQKSAIHQKQNDKCIELLRQRSNTHATMKAATTDEERYELAGKIKALTKKIDEAYDVLRHIEETGQLPFNKTDEAVLIAKGIAMMKNIQSLKAQLSQARKANDKEKEKLLTTQIEELNAQIEGYDK